MATKRNTDSRTPRSSARATTRRATPGLVDEVDEVDVSPADAQALEAEDDYITAELCGEEIQVVPPSRWRASWASLLSRGDLAGFVERAVHPDDVDLFWEIDPTNEEFGHFIGEVTRLAGEPQGNSRGRRASSRPTRRR